MPIMKNNETRHYATKAALLADWKEEIEVNGCRAKRTKDEKESYCLRKYLLEIADLNLLEYPLKITNSESPDFLICSNNKKIGVEITEVSNKKISETYIKINPENMEQEEIKDGAKSYQERLAIRDRARCKDQKTPYYMENLDSSTGNESEEKVIELILEMVKKKKDKINKKCWQPAERQDLVLYNNSEYSLGCSTTIESMLSRDKQNHPAIYDLGIVSFIIYDGRPILIDIFSYLDRHPSSPD